MMNKKDGDNDNCSQKSGLVTDALFKARTIFIFDKMTQEHAKSIIEQLLALSAVSDDEIKIFINSPGGHVESGDSIYDIIKFIKPNVKVIGTGWVASIAALIYLAAKKENRFCLPNTRFLLHQPSGGARGQASDLEIQAREIIKMRKRLNTIIANETSMDITRVEKDTTRDYWMSAEEAKEYGMVGKIIKSIAEI